MILHLIHCTVISSMFMRFLLPVSLILFVVSVVVLLCTGWGWWW